ncbi:unnamed protein product [Paramecium octaurelia]|uniref:Amino acid transporter transmembrane domain-containing protein n=1 Tax=Paramecium octaurelia TaxID=43137 RepID=A0A8S1RYP8_PAROT|nr:unnamed protein product [Paramecium octaurelia]
MANALANDALLQQEIDQQVIQNPHLSFAQKKSLRKSILKASVANAPKNSSFQTVLSVSNTMVGSSLLVIPVLFQQSGIMSALIVALVFCLISCKTCQLQVVHNKPEELDLPQTIVRILGQKYNLIFNITNIIILYFAGVVFFILQCSMLYSLVQLLCRELEMDYAPKTDFVLSKLSYQWCGIFYMCLLFLIMLQKNLTLIIKLVQYGVISIIALIIYIVINGSMNMPEAVNVSLFTLDVVTLSGVFSVAFMVHSCIVPIMKNNLQQENNLRDIAISFGWTWILYALVGSFGAIAIQGKALNPSGDGSTVLDYLDQNIFSYGIQVLQLFQLTTVFPLLAFITRSQFFALIYKLEQPPQKWFVFYTSIVAFTTLLFQCLNISVSLILSLSGAVVGFFQIYLIPIQLHMTCLYAKKKVDDNRIGLINDSKEYLENPDESIFEELDFKCLDHLALKKRLNKQTRFFIYYIIMLIGAMMGFLNIIAPFFK